MHLEGYIGAHKETWGGWRWGVFAEGIACKELWQVVAVGQAWGLVGKNPG